jgi:hypothetical protein
MKTTSQVRNRVARIGVQVADPLAGEVWRQIWGPVRDRVWIQLWEIQNENKSGIKFGIESAEWK